MSRETLAPHTPGYGGEGPAYMVVFPGGRVPPLQESGASTQRPGGMRRVPQLLAGTVSLTALIDANPGTFYSAMSNIDLEISDGNAGAEGIRFHVAQHCFLSHMDFHVGSGLAALQDVGNEGEETCSSSAENTATLRAPRSRLVVQLRFTPIDQTAP
jgi:hypothetical protein